MNPIAWNRAHDTLARRLLELARDEDLGPQGTDLTGSIFLDPLSHGRAAVVARESGVAAGLALVPMLLEVFDARDVIVRTPISDGQEFGTGAALLTLEGPQQTLARIERTLLNLVGRMCGVASLTAAYVAQAGGGAKIYDTRKTTPGLRVFEKYAVRCGGGHNHRMSLASAVLIKDNHLAGAAIAAGFDLSEAVADASRRARAEARRGPDWFFEIEVDTLEQFERVLAVEPGLIDVVLLDNFSLDGLAAAAALRRAHQPELVLEASGGVRLATVPGIARSGVDRISVGALTHSAISTDLGLDAT
ncbi:MAG: carboxylating nicotinate-nucleotide diphosphorylase [Phycisphaeraceae bacterium]|nr:carboxylating nicotinate-nucleotide diphosphorylase [Phycisphaeraceae bacterium]MCW5763229.1 carboxylating nicotinate-nucleotide diphosphorylase [Phycisphaeraceae bacterium]